MTTFGDSLKPFEAQARHYGTLLMTVSWSEAGLGLIFFTLWTVSCWKYTQRFRLDWWMSLVTLLLCCLAQGFLTYNATIATNYFNVEGFEQLSATTYIRGASVAIKYGWLAQLTAIPAVVAGKICIVSFLDNVIGNHRKSRSWFLWSLAASNVVTGVVVLVLLLTACTPTTKLWDISASGDCPRMKAAQGFSYFAGSWSAFTNFTLALYPAPIIWKLQLQTKTKVGLCILLSLGMVAGVCAAIKTSQLSLLTSIIGVSYNVAPLIVTTMTEMWITFIVACIPPSAPLVKFVLAKIKRSTMHSATHLGSDAARKRLGTKPVTFTPKSMTQFQSLAYAVGTVNDAYEVDPHSSKDNMVPDGKNIVVSTELDIQYEGKPRNSSILEEGPQAERSSGEGIEALAFDRV